MTRKTLKLPTKKADDGAAEPLRDPARKPVRGSNRPLRSQPRSEAPARAETPRPRDGEAPRRPRRDEDSGKEENRRPPRDKATGGYARPARDEERRPPRRSDGARPTAGDGEAPRRPRRDGDPRPTPGGKPGAPSGRARSQEGRPFRRSEENTSGRGGEARRDGAPARRPYREEEARREAPRGTRQEAQGGERRGETRQRPTRGGSDAADAAPQGRRFGSAAAPRPAPRTAPRAEAGESQARQARQENRPGSAPRSSNSSSELPRLSKVMSEQGLCSRREADEWIEQGWVKVDGLVVSELGSRISPKARIEIDPEARKFQSESVTILLHKPLGYVSGQAEDGYEPAVVLLKPENQWAEDKGGTRFKPAHLRRLAPAGRLDIDSTGLLVLTQDGRVAKRLIGEDSNVEKEYLVRVEGELVENGMALLNHGLSLDGVKLKPARVSWQNEEQLRFVLREGRKRQIRRMCELVGLKVVGLKRIRIGSVLLSKLPVGQWRYLRDDERF